MMTCYMMLFLMGYIQHHVIVSKNNIQNSKLFPYWDKSEGSPIYANAHSGCFENFWGLTARMGTNEHNGKKFQITSQSHIILNSY